MRIEGGASHVFHYLLSRDISQFDPGKLPFRTDAFYKLASSTRPEYEVMMEEWDEAGSDVFQNDLLCTEAVRLKLFDAGKRNITYKSIAKALHNIGWRKLEDRGQKKIDGKNKKTPNLYSKNPKKYNKLSPVKLWNAWKEISGSSSRF